MTQPVGRMIELEISYHDITWRGAWAMNVEKIFWIAQEAIKERIGLTLRMQSADAVRDDSLQMYYAPPSVIYLADSKSIKEDIHRLGGFIAAIRNGSELVQAGG